jgi:hypothetical protein
VSAHGPSSFPALNLDTPSTREVVDVAIGRMRAAWYGAEYCTGRRYRAATPGTDRSPAATLRNRPCPRFRVARHGACATPAAHYVRAPRRKHTAGTNHNQSTPPAPRNGPSGCSLFWPSPSCLSTAILAGRTERNGGGCHKRALPLAKQPPINVGAERGSKTTTVPELAGASRRQASEQGAAGDRLTDRQSTPCAVAE